MTGPNNTGKTTLMQAIATWNFALNRWIEKENLSSSQKTQPVEKENFSSRNKTGVRITRESFLSMPLRSLKLLWKDNSTSLKKKEGKLGSPRFMYITLKGNNNNNKWELKLRFYYANPEVVYAKPLSKIPPELPENNIVYIPSFSGIAVQEPIHAEAYQQWLIGQGKPGDIIRNLLLEISKDETKWKKLNAEIKDIFGYELLKPQSSGQPFILCDYLEQPKPERGYGGLPKFDIASAGSGFLQTLLLLAFVHAKPATLFLIDEPDAHLHVVLQNQIYLRLQQLMQEKKSQLLIATHSEVLVDNTAHNKILSFYKAPHILVSDTERDSVREALKRLSTMDITMAEKKFILYIEDESDLKILRSFAAVLEHKVLKELDNGFHYFMRGRKPKEASNHFFALQSIQNNMKGLVLLDSDNKADSNRESSRKDLEIHIWERYEIESYLIHPVAIERIVGSVTSKNPMREELPPAIIKNPLGKHNYLKTTPASKELLPAFLQNTIKKPDYYKIAEGMTAEETHEDIKNFLDKLAKLYPEG